MASEVYDITISNGMKVSVELETSPVVLKLHFVFPGSGKRVTFSHDPNRSPHKGRVDSGSLTKLPATNGVRLGSPHPKKMQSITDTGGSGLMLTYGDPEDPNMP